LRFLAVALAVAGKDLRSEWRGRELVPALASFPQKPGRLGAFSLVGDVSSKDRVYALKNAKLSLDGMRLRTTGAQSVRTITR